MRRRAAVSPVCLMLLVPVAPAQAQDFRVEILDYGIYAADHNQGEAAPDTVSGEVNYLSNIRLVEQTDRVFGQLGTSFGFRYRIVGRVPAGAQLTLRTIHPPLTNPATGRRGTQGSFTRPAASVGSNGYRGYSFDHRWELAEGDWTLQVLYNGRVMAEKTFRVVIPLN